MSLQVEIKGFVTEVKPHVQLKEKRIQKFILVVPGYIDRFQEKKSDDTEYEITAFDKQIPLIPVVTHGQKVKVSVKAYLNSKTFATSKGLERSLYLTLKNLEVLS